MLQKHNFSLISLYAIVAPSSVPRNGKKVLWLLMPCFTSTPRQNLKYDE